MRNHTLARTLTSAGKAEVAACSNGTGSRHVSSFPRQWRRQPPRNRIRAEAEEDRRPRAPPLQRRHRMRRLALHPLRVRHLRRRQPLRALHRRSRRRGTRHRKLPLNVLHRR